MAEKKKDSDNVPDLFTIETGDQELAEEKFEERLARLEEIVSKMESGGLTLAESIKLYEEGSAHLKVLTKTLGQVRTQVMKLVSGENGDMNLEDYNGEETS